MKAEVERLYEVFAQVPRPLKVEGCAHCVAPDEDRPLLAGPVRSLGVDVLRRYATDALILWGDVPQFRYFLPRLLELAADNEFDWPNPEVVFSKLSRGGWTEWAADERVAISAFLARWWEVKVADDCSFPDIGSVLCSLGLTGITLVPFLDRWGRLESTGAIRNLHEFVTIGVEWPTTGPTLRNPFWEEECAGHQDVVAWLADGRALAAVERAIHHETREEMLTLLGETRSLLAN